MRIKNALVFGEDKRFAQNDIWIENGRFAVSPDVDDSDTCLLYTSRCV